MLASMAMTIRFTLYIYHNFVAFNNICYLVIVRSVAEWVAGESSNISRQRKFTVSHAVFRNGITYPVPEL